MLQSDFRLRWEIVAAWLHDHPRDEQARAELALLISEYLSRNSPRIRSEEVRELLGEFFELAEQSVVDGNTEAQGLSKGELDAFLRRGVERIRKRHERFDLRDRAGRRSKGFVSWHTRERGAERDDARAEASGRELRALRAALGKLSRRDRRLVRKIYFDELSIRELADEQQVSYRCAYRRVARALARLRCAYDAELARRLGGGG